MIRLLAILTLLATPAMATQNQWPALYDVGGVASDDVLNIRAEDNASSEIIGTFTHNATDIEVIRPNDEESWGLVNVNEGHGWVSLSFLDRHPNQFLGAFPEVRSCYGTEPFWDLDREGGTLRLTGLDRPEIFAPVTWEGSTLSHRGRHVLSGGGMTGILALEECNDGMSDREFGIGITLAIPGEETLYHGCCSLAE